MDDLTGYMVAKTNLHGMATFLYKVNNAAISVMSLVCLAFYRGVPALGAPVVATPQP